MSYISSKTLSEKWGISQRRIVLLAKEGRIEGARLYGKNWLFPEDTQKPADGRTKTGRYEKQSADGFRFPSFEFRDISSFDPPLCREEMILKEATEAFYACNVKKTDKLLGNLPETAQNRYIRIAALYTGCMVDMYLCNAGRFIERYGRLCTEFDEDFPHKLEMEEYLHTLDAALGEKNYYSQEFKIDPCYKYHESFIPRLVNLCAVHISFADKKIPLSEIRANELNCMLIEDSGAYAELQSLHLSLGVAYGMLEMYKESDYHIRKALALAEKYNMYYTVAVQYYYTRNLFRSALKGFSEQFRRKFVNLSNSMGNHFLPFAEEISEINVFKLLSQHDFIFVFYAAQGLTNKEVAKRLCITEGSVSNSYSSIYAALNVSNKKELVALYRKAVRKSI